MVAIVVVGGWWGVVVVWEGGFGELGGGGGDLGEGKCKEEKWEVHITEEQKTCRSRTIWVARKEQVGHSKGRSVQKYLLLLEAGGTTRHQQRRYHFSTSTRQQLQWHLQVVLFV